MNIQPLASVIAIIVMLASCAVSPTGQRQLRLFPEAQMTKLGETAFEQTKKSAPQTKDRKVIEYVQCVANAITKQADSSLAWEVRVFESDEPNAFALPGGKIGVYTGILKGAKTQHQLAAILGHEVSHVIAEHSNARVSTAYATQGALALTQALTDSSSPLKGQLMGLLGLGAQYGIILPYGRSQESEADVLGHDLMAKAGFDPREAVALWENMSKASGGKAPPAFVSTHPDNSARIQTLQRRMPAALALYAAAKRNGQRPNCRR